MATIVMSCCYSDGKRRALRMLDIVQVGGLASRKEDTGAAIPAGKYEVRTHQAITLHQIHLPELSQIHSWKLLSAYSRIPAS
jgi:hypothetical protein